MAEFAYDMDAQRRLRALEKKMADGGGTPPHNGDMEERVKSLEEAVKNLPTKADLEALHRDVSEMHHATRADLAQLRNATKSDLDELRLTTKADLAELRLSTKADIAELRLSTKADLAVAENGIVKWVVGTALALGAAAITIMTFVLNNAIPKMPSSQPPAQVAPSPQQPIIINVPSAAPAATSSATPQQ